MSIDPPSAAAYQYECSLYPKYNTITECSGFFICNLLTREVTFTVISNRVVHVRRENIHQIAPFAHLEALLEGLSTNTRIAAIFIVSAALFALLINTSWNATPDSAFYLSLAESIATGKGYIFNGEPHTYVPPGFPLMLAFVVKLFGINFFGYRLFMAIMGFSTGVLFYSFIRYYVGKNTAFLFGSVILVNYTLIANSVLVLADIPFGFFSTLSLILAVITARQTPKLMNVIAAALIAGILPLIRINGLGFAPVIAFFLWFSWRPFGNFKKLWMLFFFLIISYLPFLLWIIHKSGYPVSISEGSYYDAVVHRYMWDQIRIVVSAMVAYFSETNLVLTGLQIKTGFLEYVLPLIAIGGLLILLQNGEKLLTSLAIVQFGGLFLSTAGERYLIFLIPALYLFLAVGVTTILEFSSKKFKKHLSIRNVLLGLSCFLFAANLAHSFSVVVQARMPLEIHGAENVRSEPYFKVANWLRTHDANGRVLSTHSRVIHYLSGCPTIALVRSGVPEHETWVDNLNEAKMLIETTKPDYVFWDDKNRELYLSIEAAIQRTGWEMVEIETASTPPRYKLFKIKKP
jgi:hypothetical protein